jgi:hypothetical protein
MDRGSSSTAGSLFTVGSAAEVGGGVLVGGADVGSAVAVAALTVADGVAVGDPGGVVVGPGSSPPSPVVGMASIVAVGVAPVTRPIVSRSCSLLSYSTSTNRYQYVWPSVAVSSMTSYV